MNENEEIIDESTPNEILEEKTEKTFDDVLKEYNELLEKYNELDKKYIKCVEKNKELFNLLTYPNEYEQKDNSLDAILKSFKE